VSVPPGLADLYRADAATRRRAQLDFSRAQVVEAGAGTGKTSILVARIVAWALGPGWERAAFELASPAPEEVAARVVRGVVAITFTEAAAAEMARRVGDALAELAAGGEPVGLLAEALPPAEVARARTRALLGQLHRLQARTIHSFCQRLLQGFPLEAGLDPGFAVDAEGLEVEAVVAEVVEEAAATALLESLDGRWLELAVAGTDPSAVADALMELVGEGVTAGRLREEAFPAREVAALVVETRAAVDGFLVAGGGRLAGARRAPAAVATVAEVTELGARLAAVEATTAEVLAEVEAEVSKRGLKRLKDWGAGKLGAAEAGAVGEAGPAVAAAAGALAGVLARHGLLRPRELTVARGLLADLLGEVERRLNARGVVTFQGLLATAADLLRRSPWLRAQVRREMRQLLVDEFQDTDRLQCEIVAWVALDGPPSERPGLFIVGDPKQTIYGWRDADLGAYEEFVGRVQREGGVRGSLAVNYRSAPPILDEVTRLVAPVMREEPGLQPAFERLLPCPEREGDPGFSGGGRGPVEHWRSWPVDPRTGGLRPPAQVAEANQVEAEALAVDLVELHREGVPWGEVAVLLRSTGELDTVLSALRSAGVPFQVPRDREYFRRREMVEAAALVRCVVDPLDPVALLAVLRSDVVGVPDAALIPLWRHGLAERMAELDGDEARAVARVRAAVRAAAAEVPGGVPGLDRLPNWADALEGAVEVLAALRRSFRDDPPDRFVERLRATWLAEATAAARHLGRHRLARLGAFHAALGRVLVERGGSRSEVARFLRRAVERGEESREPTAAEVAADAVRVMTIHGAKGLDFAHVYLLQLHRGAGGGVDRKTRALRLQGQVHYSLFGWPTPGFLRALEWQERVAEAELVRLLYVATTRAKQRLVLAGAWPAGGLSLRARGPRLMDLVLTRGRPDGEDDREERGPGREVDPNGVQWVDPALALVGGAAERVEVAPEVATPSVARIRREMALLGRRRGGAGTRMQRPMAAAVTAEVHRELERDARDEDGDAAAASPPGDVATGVGTVVHRLLETLDLGRGLAGQADARRRQLAQEVAREVDPAHREVAREHLDRLLDRVIRGELLARLEGLAPHVVARELPLLLSPEGAGGAVGYLAGRVDLVYADPGTGELVVADYKTDAVEDEADLGARVDVYAPQVELYARGVQEALELDRRPRAELWFLVADRVVVTPTSG